MTARRTTFLFTALGLLTAALFIADLAVGSVAVPLGDVWAALTGGSCDPATSDIILKIRLLKAVTALFAGAALAAGGLEMQTLFRNPLAGPYVLGVSSGAGLGVALFLLGAPLLGVAGHSFVRSLGVAGAAWLGSALVLAIVMAVSRRIKDIMVILILGMMLGSGISSVVEILQYLSSEAALKSFVIWTMGSLGDVTGSQLALLLPVVTAGLALAVAVIKPLNLLLLGAVLAWYFHTPPLSVACDGNLTFSDRRDNHDFTFDGEIIMRFHPDKTGYITVNGSVVNAPRSWEVSRQEMFKWRHVEGELYEIAIQKVERFSHDAMPPGVFEKYVAGLTLGNKRLLTIERTPEDALVISNFYSPVLICSE